MLENKGRIPETWENKLNEVFGNEDWREQFYTREKRSTLFGEVCEEESYKSLKSLVEIQEYIYSKLTCLFGYVGEGALQLYNSRNLLFSLFFAMSSDNKKAHDIGKRYWDWLIKKDSRGNCKHVVIIFHRMDGRNMESPCRLFEGIVRVSKLLRITYGGKVGNDGTGKICRVDLCEKQPDEMDRKNQFRQKNTQ